MKAFLKKYWIIVVLFVAVAIYLIAKWLLDIYTITLKYVSYKDKDVVVAFKHKKFYQSVNINESDSGVYPLGEGYAYRVTQGEGLTVVDFIYKDVYYNQLTIDWKLEKYY